MLSNAEQPLAALSNTQNIPKELFWLKGHNKESNIDVLGCAAVLGRQPKIPYLLHNHA